MRDQFISGLKRKRQAKGPMPKAKKSGSLGKNGKVYQNNLLDTDYTGGPTTSRKLKRSQMSTYKDKPAASDILATSQGDIQGNFEFLQSVFNKDHQIVFNDTNSTTAEGRHRSVGLIDGGVQAFPTDGLTGFVYATGGELYYRNSAAGPFQLTNSQTGSNFGGNATIGNSSHSGWTFLPGGLILNYGVVANPTGSSTAITFAQNFPTRIMNIMVSPQRSNTDDKVVAIANSPGPSQSGFTITYSSSDLPKGIYWMAIGI